MYLLGPQRGNIFRSLDSLVLRHPIICSEINVRSFNSVDCLRYQHGAGTLEQSKGEFFFFASFSLVTSGYIWGVFWMQIVPLEAAHLFDLNAAILGWLLAAVQPKKQHPWHKNNLPKFQNQRYIGNSISHCD